MITFRRRRGEFREDVARILPAAVGVPLIVRTDTGARAAQPMSRQVDAPPAAWAAALIRGVGVIIRFAGRRCPSMAARWCRRRIAPKVLSSIGGLARW